MKAVRDAAILLILIVLALTVRVSPAESEELTPVNRASLAGVAAPARVATPVERSEVPGPICPEPTSGEHQVFVFELNEVIDQLEQVVPEVTSDPRVKTIVRRLDLDCT